MASPCAMRRAWSLMWQDAAGHKARQEPRNGRSRANGASPREGWEARASILTLFLSLKAY